jgi:RNA polymerase sigma-70 factor (ECF subfamily)
VAFRYVEDKAAAKDIAQDVFIKLWNKRNDYTDIPSVKTFLYVLVKNASLNYVRNQKIKEKHLTVIEKQGEAFFQQVTIPEETYRQLEAVIEKLAPQSANIMRLTMKGFSNTEIAQQLGVSVNTVKTLKYNSLRSIRENLNGLSLATVLFILHS